MKLRKIVAMPWWRIQEFTNHGIDVEKLTKRIWNTPSQKPIPMNKYGILPHKNPFQCLFRPPSLCLSILLYFYEISKKSTVKFPLLLVSMPWFVFPKSCLRHWQPLCPNMIWIYEKHLPYSSNRTRHPFCPNMIRIYEPAAVFGVRTFFHFAVEKSPAKWI